MSKRQRRHFDAALKLQDVQMIQEQGLSMSEVCRDIKLGESAVQRRLVQA